MESIELFCQKFSKFPIVRNGATPLGLAACQGHTETVKALLAAGADANAKDK